MKERKNRREKRMYTFPQSATQGAVPDLDVGLSARSPSGPGAPR